MKTLNTLFILLTINLLHCFGIAQNSFTPCDFTILKSESNRILLEVVFNNPSCQTVNPGCFVALPGCADSVIVDVRKISFGQTYIFSGLLSRQFIKNTKIECIRGYRILSIEFDPVFNFGGTEKSISRLWVEITFPIENQGSNYHRYFSTSWENFIKSIVINPDDVPETNAKVPVKEEDGAEYLIITPDIFLPALEPLKTFRVRQGISTRLAGTSETGQTVASIQNYITDAYNTWNIPPSSILLAADHQFIPAPVWNSYCSSDNIYADVNGDDLPEIFISRIPVNTSLLLQHFVQRIISFETNPATDSSYYQHPLACTGFENPAVSSWMIAEIFNGWYAQKLFKFPERQYTGTVPAPVGWPNQTLFQYFGPGGLGYIPETPEYLENYTNGTASCINQALNQGAMTFFSFSGGNETGFSSPAYTISDLNGLSTAPPTLFISLNSLTGNFTNQSTDCLAEAFLKNSYGGIGVIAPSGVMYSAGSEWFTIGLIDGMWDSFFPAYPGVMQNSLIVPCQANIYAKYFLYLNSFPINPQIKQSFYHLFHYFGEAYTALHDTIPVEIYVNHPDHFYVGQEVFEMTADSGSTVALVINQQLCCVQQSNGNPMLLPLSNAQPGDTLHITATRKNHFRHYSYILCHPGVGLDPKESGFCFTILPNPTHGFVKIFISENMKDGEIELVNSAGCSIFSSDFHHCSTFSIPAGNLEAGLYFVKISDKKFGSIIKKVVIQ